MNYPYKTQSQDLVFQGLGMFDNTPEGVKRLAGGSRCHTVYRSGSKWYVDKHDGVAAVEITKAYYIPGPDANSPDKDWIARYITVSADCTVSFDTPRSTKCRELPLASVPMPAAITKLWLNTAVSGVYTSQTDTLRINLWE